MDFSGCVAARKNAMPRGTKRASLLIAGLRGLLGVATPLALVTTSSPALGYGDRAAIDIQHFQPAPGDARLVTLDLARVGSASHLGWVPQATLHYADRQLVLLCRGNCSPDVYVPWVAHRVTLDLSFALSLFDRLQLALSLPVALYQHTDSAIIDAGSDAASTGGLVAVRPNPAGLGNLKLHGKVGFLPRSSRYGLGLAVALGLPTGDGNSFLGTRLPDLVARLLGHVELGRFTLAAHFGAHFSEAVTVSSLQDGTALLYGLGGQVRLLGADADTTPFFLIAELTGRAFTRFAPAADFPTEFLIAARSEPGPYSITIGAGSALYPGVGVPNVRAFVSFAYRGGRRSPSPSH